MPVPAAEVMKTQAIGFYGQPLGAEGKEYLGIVFEKIVSAWDTWQKSITFGALAVTGGGIGVWAGVGSGGAMTGQPFLLQPFSFKANSSQQLKFTKALADALNAKFTPFPTTFSFLAVNYTGTCGATPLSPGPVSAACIPAPLLSVGKGTAPSGIADVWAAALTPPEFQLSSPQAKSGELIKAISKSIEQSFQSVWLATTTINANNLTAVGAPGGVAAGFSTGSDGKLL